MMMTFPFLEIIVSVGAVIQNDSFNCFEDLYLYVTWLIIWYNITFIYMRTIIIHWLGCCEDQGEDRI